MCPLTSSVGSYLSTYTALDYTYTYRQYCSTTKQYYYSRIYYCAKANPAGAIGGGVIGGVIFVFAAIAIGYCWWKKRKNAELQ